MKKKLKLLFVTHLFYPAIGGVELHIKNLSEGLVKRGYDVGVLTTHAYSTEAFFLGDKRKMDKAKETVNGVKVERLGYRTFGWRVLKKLRHIACRFKYPFNSWLRFYSYGPRNRSFISKIIEYNPDIIYAAPLPTMNVYYAYKAAQRLGKPLIIIPSYHIFDPCSFYNPIFFKMMRESHIVMAQSPLERDFLAKEGDIDKEKIIILPPFPLKEEQLEPPIQSKETIRRRYGITEPHVVLYLGQHGYHKKVDRVLDGMRYVFRARTDTALVIAGGTSNNTKDLKLQAKRLKEEEGGNIYFIENFPSSEKEGIFQMADIFISLSEMESFGIVFTEALNNGLPIVASKNGVAGCIAEDGHSGLLVDPTSPTEVAGAIIELLADEKLRAHFCRNGREKACTVYHPQRILDKWEEVLAALV